MIEQSTVSSTVKVETTKAWSLVVAGYSVGAVALVTFLTINGVSNPTSVVIGTAGLVIVGLMLPAAGILQIARHTSPTQNLTRYGLVMQGLGLIGLLFAVVLVYFAFSLSGYIASAVLTMTSGALALGGAGLTVRHQSKIGAPRGVLGYLVIGTAPLFWGVGLIAVSNIAYSYVISQLEKTVYIDLGATISALGCVLAAYSWFILRSGSRKQ